MTALDEHLMAPWEDGGAMSTGSRRETRRRKGLPNYRFVRYADDFAILVHGTREDTEALREEVTGVLATLGLRLSEAKTRVVHLSEGFPFLGFRIQWRCKRGTSKWHVYTFIDDRPVRSLKAKIRALTPRTSQTDLEYVLTRLNQVMHGWASYFRHAVAKGTFGMLAHFAWWRVIRMLRTRHRWKWETSAAASPTTPDGGCRSRRARPGCGQYRQYRSPGTDTAATRSPAPGRLNQPDGSSRGAPAALRGARRVRREARGNGPGAIPEPRPGPTQPTWRVFCPGEGKGPARFWLWVFIGADTVCFVMDPSRSGAVLARHAGLDEKTGQLLPAADGGPRRLVISSDFYAVYQSAGKRADGLVNLYCAAHVRRHMVRAGDASPVQLEYWTKNWLALFRDLYKAHDELMAAWQEAAAPPAGKKRAAAERLENAHGDWDTAIGVIDETRKKQMEAPGLQEPAKKALATLDREWEGLIAHRDYPMMSLDNNSAERQLRGPVVTRKNAGGSRNGQAAGNAAVIWTVTATAQMAGLNLLTYLTAYLDECGRHGGKPLSGKALERFLPWTASREDLRTWAQPPPNDQ